MQIVVETPSHLVSTEKFLVPYIWRARFGPTTRRCFESFEIRSRLLFFCVEAGTATWRFFDWRTRHTGPVDRNLLSGMMEPLF
jgi:hypothetical protein